MRSALVFGCLLVPSLVACNGGETPPAASASSATVGSATGPTTAVATLAPGELTVGKPPPDMIATASDGAALRMSFLKGKPVVLYFYPKDETPGCTKEACAFRDSWKDIVKSDAVLIGISTDTNESHQAFAKHHELPFHLVSDPNGDIAKQFGVPVNGGTLSRQTIVVGKDGNVKKIYRHVDVTGHAADITADLSQ